ncbi:MAG: AsmA family protein [Pseudomonadota bacterium]
MKKALITIGIILALILCVIIILPFVIDINSIVAKQIPTIEKQLNRKVVIGDVKLTILTGLGAEIKNVKISNSPDFKQQDFVSIDSLKATVQVLPLLKKKFLISSVSINTPSILIERDAKGRFNFSDMIPTKPPEKAPPAKPQKKDETENPLAALENISVSKISITDGNFKFIDAYNTKTAKEIALDKFNLTMKAVSLSEKINIDFETDVYASPKAGHVLLSGDIGPIGQKPVPENIPVDLTLSVDDVNLPHLMQYIKGINIKSGAVDVKMDLKGRLSDNLQCRLGIDWDKLDLVLADNTKEESAPQLLMDGSWKIEANILSKSLAEDLSFKTDMDATKGKIAFGNLFTKDAGIPLSLNINGLYKKDILKVDNLEFILNKIVLTGLADISNFADPSINGTLKMAPAPLDSLAPILPSLKAYKLEGDLALSDVRFKGKINKLKNLTGVAASLTLKNGSATSAELGKKIESIQVAVNIADNAVKIQNTSLRIGPSDLSLNATIRNIMKPDITFNLASNYLDIDTLMPASAKEKQKAIKKEPKAGESKAAESKTKTSEKQKAPDLKAQGKISIKKCKYNKSDFENVSAEIQYENAVATLKNISFDSFDGNIKANAKVNLSDMQSPKWDMDLATKNINVNKVLNQFTSIQDTLFGNVNSNLSIQGKGSDWNIISKSLAGKGSADITNGKLANVNILDAVSESLLKFKGLNMVAQAIAPEKQKSLNETAFKDLAGKFSIEAGKIALDTMKISAKDFILSGKGAIGLDKSLDLNTAVLLTKSASERFQKDKTLKYLLNNDQQLEIPCTIKGDVTSPQIAADGNSLNRLLGNAASKVVQEQVQKKLDGKVGKELDNVLKNIFK